MARLRAEIWRPESLPQALGAISWRHDDSRSPLPWYQIWSCFYLKPTAAIADPGAGKPANKVALDGSHEHETIWLEQSCLTTILKKGLLRTVLRQESHTPVQTP